jgi:hypothetical protein
VSKRPEAPQGAVDAMGFVLGDHLRIELGLLTAALDAGSLFRNSQPKTPPALGGCYEASFGWAHVRPGCRCR